MKSNFKKYFSPLAVVATIAISATTVLAQRDTDGQALPSPLPAPIPVADAEKSSTDVAGADTGRLIYPLAKPEIVTYDDLQQKSPADLRDPSNVRHEVDYDPDNGYYIYRTKVGDMDIATPFVLDAGEYSEQTLQESMNAYWNEKNSANVDQGNKYSLEDLRVNIGPTGDKIFGEGGVTLKTQGSVDLTFGLKHTRRDNPSIAERNRKTNIFDFDTKIQLNATGKVGDRVKFNMNYNTEATFDFDQSLINLSYEGKEDNIIKKIEAGNVTLPLSTQLITGANALFGVRTDMQFGKLRVSALAAQQQSERKNISTKGGAQTTEFEIKAADYEANRHFFLSQFFYDNYDEWMAKIPTNASGVVINKVEVWVTSTSTSAEKTTRNVIAFTELGEPESNPDKVNPSNMANGLYSTLTSGENAGIRNYGSNQLEMVQYNGKYLENGVDYEVVNSARMLNPDEFRFNPYLGTVSLRSTLNPSDVCAVAFQYTYKGKSYKVGELSTDRISSDTTSSTLFVKLLKSTSNSPSNPRLWKLMMKNVYSLAAYNVSPEKFKLDIQYYYSNDSISSYLKYLPISNIKKTPLIKVLNLDRLNSKHKAISDGYFDFVDGYTVDATNGRIYLPSVEPFGSGLIDKINDKELAKQYAFTELYEYTQSDAKEFAEKDKFILTGEYRSSSGSQIRLGATNVPRGSVKVTAGGRTLVENEGFTVDYNMGVVTILDEVALSSNTPINVSLESESFFNTQRKSLLGTTLQYDFNEHFTFGGTLMHLNEKPYTQKVAYGEEPISNTIWGLNAAYNTPSQWLTDVVDKLPLINATVPSSIAVSGEFAQLIPGHANAVDGEGGGVSYIDDFEGTKSSINILSPLAWTLASTPVISDATYVGHKLIRETDAAWGDRLNSNRGHLGYGMNRAHFAWFRIDQVLNNTKGSNDTPKSLTNQKDVFIYNNLVRLVHEQELYPLRENQYGESTILPTLNLSFYPQERGPYNLDISGMNADGTLADPENRWGGIMRKIENTDFNKSNVAYIEFWMMDPFDAKTLEQNPNVNLSSGKLVFNLGEVSEDVLKDGRVSFENGLPTDELSSVSDTTIWGRVPRIQAITYAFDVNNIEKQDVGIDGLSTYDEHQFSTYKFYLDEIKKKLNNTARAKFDADIHSPLNDPAGDDFTHFLGSQHDNYERGILYRYKYYNGMEGNSSSSSSNYSSSTNTPDVEDLNMDHTLNEKEQYFEYVVDIDKSVLENESQWATHYIASKVTTFPKVGDDNVVSTWYQFRIPIDAYNRKEGSISNFQSIRYIRMYMTGFSSETQLRFGALNLVRTDWRVYSQNKNLFEATYNDGIDSNGGSGSISISSVNIENDRNKQPVGYDLPPGVSRVIDPSQTQVRQENEQSMLISLDSLGSKQARAAYKKMSLDMRRYKSLRMFVHAEDKDEVLNPTGDNHLFLFLRLGSDLTENYYEYQIPLTITPRGATDKYLIWPEVNNVDFAFDMFTNLKKQRDRAKTAGRVHINERFTENDERNGNLITVMGNPSFGEISSIMIGVRNEDKVMHSADIWVNELRMVGFDEDGGCAGLGNLGIVFSDLGSVSLGGRIEQAGFGGIEDNVDDRRKDDYYEYNFAANVQLGKLFPEKAKVNLPFTYTLEKTVSKPKYDPLNSDLTLKESIENQTSEHAKDSIRDMSLTTTTYHSYNVNNVRVGITSEKPMPYDPANFSFSFGYNETTEKSPEVQYDVTRNYNGILNYAYNLNLKSVEPFKKVKAFKSNNLKLIRDFNFTYLPNSYAFSTNMKRYYNEVQLRDYSTVIQKDTSFPYLAWDKDWTWSRNSDIKWNLTKSLKLSFSSAQNSQIDEIFRDENGNYRDVPVNKSYLREINADDWYERWKDTVWSSIKHFGTPIEYNQRFTANWNVPINKLPYLDWITSNAQYSADYTWDRGAETVLGQYSESGNIAFSKRQWNGDVRFNFETLYNKSNYLKEINKRFSNSKPRNVGKKGPAKDDKKMTKEEKKKAKQAEKEAEAKRKEDEAKPKVYERKNIRLRKDNKTRISHRLGTTKLTVTLTDKDGKSYPAKFKVVDQNVINLIGTEDVSNLTLKVVGSQKQRTAATEVLDITARVLMSVRNLTISYREIDALTLTGYNPESGFLGQDGKAPGYGFTFGFYNADKYLKKVQDHGWMLQDSNIVTNPVIKTKEQDLQVKSSVMPFPGIKIDLNAAWMKTRVDDIYYMYEDANTFTGSYSRTHIAIKTAFKGKKLNSELFNNFLDNRNIIRNRVKTEFIRNTGITDAGEYQDKLSPNSSDVLVPAFLAAYTGRSASSQKLDLLPSMLSMLPNWRVSVDLLSRWEYMQNYLKSLTLTHAYKCTYNVNSYSSLTDWTDLGGGYGEVAGTSVELDNGYFSSQYTVDNVNINESFSPLIGAEATLKNSLALKAEVKRSRTNSLDVNALQVVESYSNEYVFGAGYRIDDFGAIVHLANDKQKTIKNDLNLRLDVSYKLTDAYIRKIEDMYSQLSSGINSFIIKFSADYVLSSRINVRFYYDRTASTPKVSTSYPMVSSDFGVGIKVLLSK